MSIITLDKSYQSLLADIKVRIQKGQQQAAIKVNQELVLLYWEIGKHIIERQRTTKWGGKLMEHLAADLKKTFPNMKGFSKSNLKYMSRFASAYAHFEIGQVPLVQISWYHNITLLQKVKDETKRLWYAQKALEHGWSRNVMVHQIELNLYDRKGKAITNFSDTLPSPQSDMAKESLKDPYILDFLGIREDVVERELEDAIVQHITKFLLELGVGFAFVGRQYNLDIGGEDFFIDLLFYHLQLRCYVVIELKTGKFKPEHAGKMNFYLSAIDDILKTDLDQPSIGIILCKDKNRIQAEYALKDINKPIGISEYKLTNAIPENLQSKLPTIEEFERELKEIEVKEEK